MKIWKWKQQNVRKNFETFDKTYWVNHCRDFWAYDVFINYEEETFLFEEKQFFIK